MKRCPQCNRVETDEALGFCRVDGTALVNDSSSFADEAGTVRLDSASAEAATTVLPDATNVAAQRGTGPTTVLPPQPTATTGALGKSKLQRKRIGTMALVTAMVAAISAVVVYSGRSKNSHTIIQSIAVMPFVNASGNADVEYLSDGMTETLISSLSQLQNLNVKPRSSVFRYKGKETDPQTVAKELNVEAVLNGRVVQHGQEIDLFVELIDTALNKVVWSQQYNRKQSDLVSLQTDVARDISSRLKTKLSGADEAKVTKTYTTNPEAYQLYLKGNFYQSKYTDEGYRKAIEYYKQAIAVDPNYALAYHGIARAYDFANGFYLSANEAEPKAKIAALKALELDETLAETHYLLAKIVFWYDWDWPTSERESKRANQLDSTYPAYYPVYLEATGRFHEAVQAQEVMLQRFPLDLNVNLDFAAILLSAGRYDESIEQTRKAL